MNYSVPGTAIRQTGKHVQILEFNKVIEILASKQRPRKLTIRGSDGKTYRFLLKPREDLRMDERCMQLVRIAATTAVFSQANGLT